MTLTTRPLAVVTGGSSGIGLELAKLFAADDYDLVIASDDGKLDQAKAEIGGRVETLHVDLSTEEGVDRLYDKLAGRPVSALAANAGHGLGHAFLDQDWKEARGVIDTNVTGTCYLIHRVGRDMRQRGEGRILITSSIASQIPGTFHAVYNASKAFVQSFSFALRNELKDSGVVVTALLPGVTDTDFFERADLMDTKVGQTSHKADPADVAKTGYQALMKGEGDATHGADNKAQVAMARITPDTALAEQHRKMAEPGH